MAAVPEKVLNWLYSVLPSEYADVTRTYHDVVESLAHYPSLTPRTEVYTYDNGASALLLLLSGTLPVAFRGSTYSFPVAIWVPHAYPRDAPIVYVKPAPDMVVRPGQHVSSDGRVYHPYLAQWGKYWDKSTIFDFLAVLKAVFAKEPPVRSRQTKQEMPSMPAPPPVPPPPAEWRRSIQGEQTASPSQSGPALPPKPPGGATPSQSPAQLSQAPAPPPKPPGPGQNGDISSPSRYNQPAPLPPQPHAHQNYHRVYPAPNVQQQQGSPYQNSPNQPVPRPPRPYIQAQSAPVPQQNSYQLGSPVSPLTPQDQQQARYQRPAPLPNHPNPSSQQQQYPPPTHQLQNYGPPPLAQGQARPPQPVYHQASLAQHVRSPPKPPINLLDDPLEVTIPSQSSNQVPLPVPPVPPNPEKDALLRALSQALCAQIRQAVDSNQAAVAPLRAQQAALQTAYSRLQGELDQLMQLDAALASNEKILKETMLEADRVMGEARTRKVPDVDEVLVAPTVVGGQLYNSAAEESAIADTLFVLGRAMDRNRVGAEVFVKQTRSLARERFMKRALVKKIAKGLSLDTYEMPQ